MKETKIQQSQGKTSASHILATLGVGVGNEGGGPKGEEIFLLLIRKQKCGEFKQLIPGRWQKLGARAAQGAGRKESSSE